MRDVCFSSIVEKFFIFVPQLPENLIFEGGIWTKYHDIERTKRWQSLSKLQSRARLSKCKLGRDYANIKDTLTVKLNLEVSDLSE